jgi:hypothetical protein
LEKEMNKPVVSLETLERLEVMEQDKAMEMVMRRHGFTGADLSYGEVDGERRLLIGRCALDYLTAHKKVMKREIEDAINTGSIKALEAGLTIIELQKMGGAK